MDRAIRESVRLGPDGGTRTMIEVHCTLCGAMTLGQDRAAAISAAQQMGLHCASIACQMTCNPEIGPPPARERVRAVEAKARARAEFVNGMGMKKWSVEQASSALESMAKLGIKPADCTDLAGMAERVFRFVTEEER